MLRVEAVGLCGSDAHWYEEGGIGDSNLDSGLILGHEFSGVIESGSRSGERVAIDPAIPCLVCEQCRLQRHHLCTDLRFAGHGNTHGALRGHLVWPERCLIPVPAGLSDGAGALLEPLGVALHAIDLADLDPSMSVAVVGCGPIGLLIVIALGATGVSRIGAIEPLSHRRQAAGELGATVGPTISQNSEFDVVFDAAGTDKALKDALQGVRPAGRVVVVGIPAEDRTSITASLARRKELTLVWCRRMVPGDLARAAELAGSHTDTLDSLVTHRFGLGDVAEAFETLVDRRGLKVVVTPDTNRVDGD